MQVNDIVIFSPRQGETAEGIVTRVWDKPKSDPYVTVHTYDEGDVRGRTFVRCSSEVRAAHDPEACRNGDHYGQCSGATLPVWGAV